MNKNTCILEAILFIAGDGVEKSLIKEKLLLSDDDLKESVKEIKQKYSNGGIKLIEFNDKLQFCTNSEFSEEISLVLNPVRERQLSKSMLETIAIIAYKQPVTRLEVENIRGLNSDYAFQVLLKHNLIEVVGRKDALGRPLLFGTTDQFLKHFDLTSLNDLPSYDELMDSLRLINESKATLYADYEVPTEKISDEERQALEDEILSKTQSIEQLEQTQNNDDIIE